MSETSIKIFVGALCGVAFMSIIMLCDEAGYIRANHEFHENCLKMNAHLFRDLKFTCSIN